ncbi:MAG TPA: hypothetical protein VD794_04740, partial [Flavisolibacter sp.]|nr:hypothetical protein [Flavisolibacter sp.]
MFIKLAFNRILSIVLLLCSFFMVPKITAQEEGGPTVKVQFKVLELGITKLDKKVDPVFKFYLGKEDGVLLNGTGTCYKFSSKSSTKSFVLPDPAYPGWEVLKPFSVPILSRPAFTLTMECFSNDKGGACTFDKKDDYHSITSKLIDLNAFTPGDYSDTIRISDRDNKFWSLVEFRYTLLRPNNIRTTSGLQAVNLANKMITLSTAYELVNKERLRFTWEYSEDKGNTWSRLAGSKEDPFKLIIDPLKDLFDEHLVTTKEILFRFRVNSRDTFTISDTFKTAFTPLPPSFQKDNVKVTQTCSGRNNGSIKIRNIQTVCNKAYYLLRLASEEAVACQLSDPASMNCSGIVKSGTITNGMIDIKQLPAEAYTLFLYNGDIPIGDIYSKHHFTIESYQKLSIEKVVSRNPSCMDEKAGQIWVQAAGGSTTDLWSVSLTPKQGLPDLNLSDKQIGFKNLLEGSYALEVIDGCGEREVRNFELKKPEK